jgi:hypothetical protein
MLCMEASKGERGENGSRHDGEANIICMLCDANMQLLFRGGIQFCIHVGTVCSIQRKLSSAVAHRSRTTVLDNSNG